MPKYEEYANQVALVNWFKRQYPKYDGLFVHVPNGQNIGPKAGARLKKAGLTPGVPDMMLMVPRQKQFEVEQEGQYGPRTVIQSKWVHGLFIEMKAKNGKVLPVQKEMHNLLREQHYQVEVCYSWTDASEVIKEYLNEKQ